MTPTERVLLGMVLCRWCEEWCEKGDHYEVQCWRCDKRLCHVYAHQPDWEHYCPECCPAYECDPPMRKRYTTSL